MGSKRHDRITELFLQACALDSAAREAFLDEACAGNAELRAEIDSLLAHDGSRLLETGAGASRVAEVIRDRPKGLDAALGKGGVLLSAGQRQRISIARALYGDPSVLVFDEATAALDNTTEKEVSASISGLSGIKTIICIAYRLTTIRNSDVIHFVTEGRIAASGTYDELYAESEEFRHMAMIGESAP